MYQKPAEQSFGADAMDYETVFVYRVDRNVQILNHCLDDIEVFISKLQKASQAASELTERRRKRTQNSKKSGRDSVSSYGEGMYSPYYMDNISYNHQYESYNMSYYKLGCVITMVIWPEFRMAYRANDHPYQAPQFMTHIIWR